MLFLRNVIILQHHFAMLNLETYVQREKHFKNKFPETSELTTTQPHSILLWLLFSAHRGCFCRVCTAEWPDVVLSSGIWDAELVRRSRQVSPVSPQIAPGCRRHGVGTSGAEDLPERTAWYDFSTSLPKSVTLMA